MITVTRFDQTEFVVNADLIEFIETRPDTHITLVTGKKLLVRETAQEVVARVLDYRRAAGPLLRRPETGEHAPADDRED
ncbi:MAG: flagellar FlbD family protein [Armatimonadetes bacterium]|nr:flagellar FlbD family protein [Armatimonadota bacterium]